MEELAAPPQPESINRITDLRRILLRFGCVRFGLRQLGINNRLLSEATRILIILASHGALCAPHFFSGDT